MQLDIPDSEKDKFVLVLSGGGTTGIGEVGALLKLDELGLLNNKTHFYCSSVGSLIGGMLACKASISYIYNSMNKVNYEKFKDDSFGFVMDIARLLDSYGWYKGDFIEKWFGDHVDVITGKRNITLKEVHDRYGTYLCVPVLLNYTRTIFVDHTTDPDLELVQLIRRASAMELYYKGIKDYSSPDGKLRMMSDGGLFVNFPFDQAAKAHGTDKVLGLNLMSSKQLHELRDGPDPVPELPPNLIYVILNLVDVARELASRVHIKSEYWNETIKIDCGDISSTNFSITKSQKEILLNNGKKAVEDYLASKTK